MQLGGRGGIAYASPPPPYTPLILTFEYTSIVDIYQSYVEDNSYQMSCINHNNKQDTDIIFHFSRNL